MRFSVLITWHDEGDGLRRTIESCTKACGGGDYEIVVVDDASTDHSAVKVKHRFPSVRMVQNSRRFGAAAAKVTAVEHSRGNVLVFLDALSNPEPGAILRLVRTVENLQGQGVVTPQLQALDLGSWRNSPAQAGHGYRLNLEDLCADWIPFRRLRPADVDGEKLFLSPALHGGCFAVSRALYAELHGFDPLMKTCGLEDLDLGLRCWLMGYAILHDPCAIVGHCFRKPFAHDPSLLSCVVTDQLRVAHKCFTQSVASQWVRLCRNRVADVRSNYPEGVWARAWLDFFTERSSVDQERQHLLAHRTRDEFEYAREFELRWPCLAHPQYDFPGVRDTYAPDGYAMYPCEMYPCEMYSSELSPLDVCAPKHSQMEMYSLEKDLRVPCDEGSYPQQMYPPES
jgi:GT2 family glycosyltransferase